MVTISLLTHIACQYTVASTAPLGEGGVRWTMMLYRVVLFGGTLDFVHVIYVDQTISVHLMYQIWM